MVIDLHMMSQQASKNARMINTLQLIHIDIMVCSMKTPRELRLCELVGRGVNCHMSGLNTKLCAKHKDKDMY